mgnify:CR=1 FL=1
MSEMSFPGLNLSNLYQLVLLFFFASLRISSMLISAPFFSTSFITIQIRIVMSVGITAFIFPDITVPEIHRVGTYKVQVKLHSEVTAEINLEVTSY